MEMIHPKFLNASISRFVSDFVPRSRGIRISILRAMRAGGLISLPQNQDFEPPKPVFLPIALFISSAKILTRDFAHWRKGISKNFRMIGKLC